MDYAMVLVNALISIVVAACTGWISAKLTYSKEIEKKIYEKRQELYIELFSTLEKLEKQPYLVYNTEQFITPFRQLKASANLYASRAVLDIVVPFNDRIISIWSKYIDLYESEEAAVELSNRQIASKEEGVSAEQIQWEFQQEAEMYMDQNIIPSNETRAILDNLATQIRSELKTE